MIICTLTSNKTFKSVKRCKFKNLKTEGLAISFILAIEKVVKAFLTIMETHQKRLLQAKHSKIGIKNS
jgi:hypothetical protein